jgi:hypothetical protein
MTTLADQIESTRERFTREQQRLVLGTARAGKALSRAARDEARSWQSFVTTEQRRVSEAVASSIALVRSKSGLERAALRVADKTLSDLHDEVTRRLSRIDRELAADASDVPTTTSTTVVTREPKSSRPRARRPSRKN